MIKALVDEITLTVNGREITFTEEELIAIVEKHFANETTEVARKAEEPTEKSNEVAETPTEGKWFEVNPLTIDRNLFSEKREDSRQEETRKLILKALAEVDAKPERYARKFKTLIPAKTWDSKPVKKFRELACKLGDHMADWVEQALEWAQRIANGETWGTVCNDPDTANFYRLVVWKNGYAWLVGGSRKSNNNYPASDVDNYGRSCYSVNKLDNTVPLVVLYE